MLGARLDDELVVHLRLVHFRLEGSDLIRRHQLVGAAMFDQHPGLHHARLRRGIGPQWRMEGGHAGQRRALAGHVQHHPAAEAVADGGDPGAIGLRLLLEQLQRGVEARLGRMGVLQRLLHEAAGLLGVRADLAAAVHVDGHGAVAERGEVAGAALGVVVQAPELVHHQHARARTGLRVVVGEVADHLRAVGGLVGNFPGLDRGLGAEGEAEEQQDGE
ncbi:hypothetical protein D3C76_1184880 [compost metagenome]